MVAYQLVTSYENKLNVLEALRCVYLTNKQQSKSYRTLVYNITSTVLPYQPHDIDVFCIVMGVVQLCVRKILIIIWTGN